MEKWEWLLKNFLLCAGNLMRSNFDLLNLFQSQKPHSVNIEHQLKLKLL